MKKIFAILAAAVMSVTALAAVPAAEVSAYTEGDGYVIFSSVQELSEYLAENGGDVVVNRSYSDELFEGVGGDVIVNSDYSDEQTVFEDVESLWVPAGYSDKMDSVKYIHFYEDKTYTISFGDGTIFDCNNGDSSGYSYAKAKGDSKKVNSRTVYKYALNGRAHYLWKQSGTYFRLVTDGWDDWSLCAAEEYIIPYYGTEGLRTIGGKRYYVQSDGSYYVGWKTLNGNKYFFGMDGAALTKNTTIGNVRYTFDENGVCTGLYTGWLIMDGYRYYCKSGRFVTGVNKISGKTYTFNDDGILMY